MWWNNHTFTADDEDTMTAEAEDVDSQTLTDACLLLFGDDTPVSPAFINYMQIAGLKAAFRNMAMRNHPDLAAQTGIAAPVLNDRFTAIRQAYELLLPYVSGEKTVPQWGKDEKATTARIAAKPAPVKRAAPPPSPAPGARFTQPRRPERERAADRRVHTFASGELPRRYLRFAEFLYYHRDISWENLFAALVWQRLRRPRLGEIALEKGLLKASDMIDIRRHKQLGEVIGDTALRLGLIHPPQLRLLLGYQKLYDCPIGRYFVEEGLLKEDGLNNLLRLHRNHNFAYKSRTIM